MTSCFVTTEMELPEGARIDIENNIVVEKPNKIRGNWVRSENKMLQVTRNERKKWDFKIKDTKINPIPAELGFSELTFFLKPQLSFQVSNFSNKFSAEFRKASFLFLVLIAVFKESGYQRKV